MPIENTPEPTPVLTGEETHSEAGGPIGAVAGQFGLNGQMFAGQMVNFLIVLIVLWIFAYKPIVKMLDERSEKIEKSIKQADQIEKRLKDIEDERENVVTESKKQAQEIIEKAQKNADLRGQEIIVAAKDEVEKVITKSKQQLVEERVKMMRELRQDIIEISLAAAGQVLKTKVDQDKSQEIAEEVVNKMT